MLNSPSIELHLLLFSAVLGLAELMAATQAMTAQLGNAYNLSNREGNKSLTGLAGRMDRAFKNFKETYVFFVAAMLVVHLTGQSSWLSQWGGGIYLVFRVLHFAVYSAGITVLRTLCWLGSLVGLVMVMIAAF